MNRKPEPLGSEFKDIVDGVSGEMVWLELQEGKNRMATKPWQDRLGATAACVLRGVIATADCTPRPESFEAGKLYLGDSWFGSVKSVANVAMLGHHACMLVKTAHSRSPKKFLDETMKDFPGGTWITLEGRAQKEGIDLVCVGYKYNKKTVLTFVFTKGAGSTAPGESYEARFPDKYGNVCVRHVSRPALMAYYFKYSNCVDLHNQARQFDLKLEKKWVTHSGYFRLYTTILGMTVTDAWKIYKNVDKHPISICQYADMLADDMMRCAEEISEDELSLPQDVTTDSEAQISSLSSVDTRRCGRHTKVILKSQIRCVWCSRVNLTHRKTTLKCKECGSGFCRDESGRMCWSHHLALGGCPMAPKRGTLKRNAGEDEGGEDDDD